MTRLRFHPESGVNEEDIRWLTGLVEPAAAPLAVFKSSLVTRENSHALRIDGVRFESPLLQVNLAAVDRVFPYAVTIGKELDSLRLPDSRSKLIYSLGILREMVLDEALNYLQTHIARCFNLDYLWQLDPGYLQAWPADGRKQIFSILGDVKGLIGIELLADAAFQPVYSGCGIFYYSEMEFEACQVCPQDPCMGRRAPYNRELAARHADKAGRPCGARTRNPISS